MGSNVGTALGIMGIIIGAGAIGFAFFVWNGQNTTNSDLKSDLDDLTDQLNNLTGPTNMTAEFNDLPRTIVVGNWEGLARNMAANIGFPLVSNWLFELQAGTHYNSYYINAFSPITRIYLVTAGWYRIHLSTLLYNLDPGNYYSIEIFKNGINSFVLYIFDINSGDPDNFYVDSSAFIYSDGTDYIEINGKTGSDDFYPISNNRFTIEYVAI